MLQLSVEAGFISTGSDSGSNTRIVYAPGCGTFGYANAFVGVNELINKANLDLAGHGYTHDNDINRANQQCLNDAIESANNNLGFVQLLPCPLTPAVSSRPGVEQPVDVIAAKASIWPNPATGFFTLKPATTVSDQKVQFRVFDATGKLVYSDNGRANKNYRFGGSFTPGLYLIEILQGSNRETFKLVKQ
jgi:hypothetical protein